MNIDGQQITQRVAGPGSVAKDEPRSDRRFQVVTNIYDITQGRSMHPGEGDLASAPTTRTAQLASSER
jgi:hypothetical protein